jgi:hypothetical protein
MKTALLAAALMCGVTGTAWAVGGLVEVNVYDRAESRILPVYHHEGRYYVVGKPGNEYQISVRNNAGRDILAVVSVDGVNAVTGETAHIGQSGYVLGPSAGYKLKGWRKSLQRTAAFYFTERGQSYAARTGRPDQVGVIGVAVFRSKTDPVIGTIKDYRGQRKAPAAEGEPANAWKEEQSAEAADRALGLPPVPGVPEQSLGTGHGRSEHSPVRYASFERVSSAPDEVVTIYYDSYRNLVAQGVIAAPPRIARPVPFPGQFVPDPH